MKQAKERDFKNFSVIALSRSWRAQNKRYLARVTFHTFHFFDFFFFLPASSNTGTGNEQNSSNASSEPYAENVRGQVFTVGPRYTSLQYIGEGAYGMVV